MERTALYRRELPPPGGRARLASFGIVIGFHAALLAAFLWAGFVAPPKPAEDVAIQVNILPQPKQLVLQAPEESLKVKLVTPPPVAPVPPPDIVIASPDPSPITVTTVQPSNGNGTRNKQAAMDDYLARLRTHISKFMDLPALSRMGPQRGTAVVHFLMDANDHVTLVEIKQSSGSDLLDREALAMIRRADPLPAPPAALGTGTPNITMPLSFIVTGTTVSRNFSFSP